LAYLADGLFGAGDRSFQRRHLGARSATDRVDREHASWFDDQVARVAPSEFVGRHWRWSVWIALDAAAAVRGDQQDSRSPQLTAGETFDRYTQQWRRQDFVTGGK